MSGLRPPTHAWPNNRTEKTDTGWLTDWLTDRTRILRAAAFASPWLGQSKTLATLSMNSLWPWPRWGEVRIFFQLLNCREVGCVFCKSTSSIPYPHLSFTNYLPTQGKLGLWFLLSLAALWATHLCSLLLACSFVGFGNGLFRKMLRHYYSCSGNSQHKHRCTSTSTRTHTHTHTQR